MGWTLTATGLRKSVERGFHEHREAQGFAAQLANFEAVTHRLTVVGSAPRRRGAASLLDYVDGVTLNSG